MRNPTPQQDNNGEMPRLMALRSIEGNQAD
jgi:hypothetical protein